MGILPGHAALLGQLGTGFLSYVVGGRKSTLSVQGGFVEVLPDHVRVLANIAERAEEIDIEKAKADLARANEQVINPALGVDPAVALEALAWAQARVDAAAQK
jgi:F-type H+-transporting ATPase subunit epsilon